MARSDGNGSLFYHYDGRGNVTQLTNAQQQVVAKYGYDAFGNTSASGTAAGQNRYRFSTKEQIGALYYYGYRFYSASLGRWINRDPIAEAGGVNLYGFVSNSPLNLLDTDGRWVGIVVGGVIGGIAGGWTNGWIGAVSGAIGGMVGGAIGSPMMSSVISNIVQTVIQNFLKSLVCKVTLEEFAKDLAIAVATGIALGLAGSSANKVIDDQLLRGLWGGLNSTILSYAQNYADGAFGGPVSCPDMKGPAWGGA